MLNKCTVSITLRLRPEELEYLRQQAAAQDISVSAYMRELIKGDMRNE